MARIWIAIWLTIGVCVLGDIATDIGRIADHYVNSSGSGKQ